MYVAILDFDSVLEIGEVMFITNKLWERDTAFWKFCTLIHFIGSSLQSS